VKTNQDVNNFLSSPLDFPSLTQIKITPFSQKPQIIRMPMD